MSRVVRTARTAREIHEKERAEHACYSHIHDEVTVYDAFPATIQKLDEDENLPEDTTAQDDQEDETEQSLSETLQTQSQLSKIHENMGHPSNRTLVRVLRLGGAKRRFILAAARHRCGACEAQERPAGPIESRSPTSFVFNDVVGLDMFFLNAYGNNWLRSYGRLRILVVDQQRSLCSGIFAEKVESDGTRLEVTPLEAPWRNGKTECAGKDWKADYYKMTQDGPGAHTWTDSEEDCDAVNQARTSKINDSGYSAYQHVFGKNHPQMEDAVLECGGADLGVVSLKQTGELTQERSMTMRRIAPQASLALDHKRRWKRALHHAAKHYKGELHVGQPLWFWRRGANAAKRPTSAFWHPGVVISNTLSTLWTAYRGSVVKCAPSQVRPSTKNDKAAHGHITDHMRDLGERLLHAGDFSYEDITGQDEPHVDSPTAPDGEGQVDVDPESRRRMGGKIRLTSLQQPPAPTANTSPDTTKQETKEDHDDKRRRFHELE